MRRAGDALGRRYGNRQQQLKQQLSLGMKGLLGRLSVAVIVLLICTVSLFSTFQGNNRSLEALQHVTVDELWSTAASGGWRPSSAPRSDWPPPPVKSNGYLRVRCNGGLNQQRSAICNAVLAARIMNATLVLPELDANSFWHDDSGFQGIYDVEHFIKSLRYDVHIVEKLPEIHKNGKTKKMKAYQLRPPRDAPISWYTMDALEKMNEHGAIYLTPFSHRLAEEIDNPEYQRLRCRVNYHALRFKPHIMQLSNSIVSKLRAQGHFMAIHLRFEMDMLAFAGCIDIFNPKEQSILKKYRKENFAEKELVYSERRAIGKCPLTPEEVGLILRAMGFDNSTRIYLAAVRRVMFNTNFGGPHKRVQPESFYTNSWPDCFCQTSPKDPADQCPPENVLEILNSRLHGEETDTVELVSRSNVTKLQQKASKWEISVGLCFLPFFLVHGAYKLWRIRSWVLQSQNCVGM
ncbi:hypothetical protein ACSBR2_032284 [Camellia fascicularis]